MNHFRKNLSHYFVSLALAASVGGCATTKLEALSVPFHHDHLTFHDDSFRWSRYPTMWQVGGHHWLSDETLGDYRRTWLSACMEREGKMLPPVGTEGLSVWNKKFYQCDCESNIATTKLAWFIDRHQIKYGQEIDVGHEISLNQKEQNFCVKLGMGAPEPTSSPNLGN